MYPKFHVLRRKEAPRLRRTVVALSTSMVALLVVFASHGAAQEVIPMDPAIAEPLRTAILQSNPSLRAARASVEAAQARLSGAGLAPAAVLTGEIEDVAGGTDLKGADVRLQVEREFLTGGRRSAARSLASADVRVAEATLYAAERRILARGYAAVARLAASRETARRLAAEDSLLLAAEASLRDRFAVGEARYVDVLRLRTERLRVQSERAEALTSVQTARSVLAGLVSQNDLPQIETLLADRAQGLLEGPVPPAPDLDSLITAAGALRLSDAVLERARAERELVLAEQRPRISAALGAQRIAEEIGGGSFGPVLETSITLPFTARGANRAVALAAEREVAAAVARRAAVVATIRADLSAALARYEAARERLAVYNQALLRGVREERESALAAYRAGELSLIELLDFERALARAEIERLGARADAAEALADLLAGATRAADSDLNP